MINFHLPQGVLLTSSCGVPLNHLLMVSRVTINVSALLKCGQIQKYDSLSVTCQSAAIAQANHGQPHTLFLALCLKNAWTRLFLAPHLSFITLLSLVYSLPSVCTDKMVFHTHLKDTDLIRGNQSPAAEKINCMEIMQNATLIVLLCLIYTITCQCGRVKVFSGIFLKPTLHFFCRFMLTTYLNCLKHLEASIDPNIDD